MDAAMTHQQGLADELLARILPVTGKGLARCRVAVWGKSAALLVMALAGCGIRRWLALEDGASMALGAQIADHYGPGLALEWETLPARQWATQARHADLVLVVSAPEVAAALPPSMLRLLVMPPTTHTAAVAVWALPGEVLHPAPVASVTYPLDTAAWVTDAQAMAALVKALLLRTTSYAPRGWAWAWEGDARSYQLGSDGDPTHALCACVGSPSRFRAPMQRRGTLLVVGLGSLGSVAAKLLAPWVERLVLVDPDRVALVNVARQAYAHSAVGRLKAEVLAEEIAARHALPCVAQSMALTDEVTMTALIRQQKIELALLTTGTEVEFALARALSAAGVAHVAGRCYPRAAYWEGIVVEGQGGPSYGEVRRDVRAGPTPHLTAAERAAYGASAGDLQSEPATGIETGWAAAWLARLTIQLGLPSGLRERWFLARQAAGATCWIGGLVVERSGNNAVYAVDTPGQVRVWTAQQIRAPGSVGKRGLREPGDEVG